MYSIFNQFFIDETTDFFNSIGIETYTQDDNRIFPKSNKSLDVIFALKNEVKRLGISVEKVQINNIDFFCQKKYISKRNINEKSS